MNSAKQTFSIVSLGCARNLVDSEVMAGLLRENGFDMVAEPAGADIVLVNTCGFIEAAKAESIDTIVDIGKLKEEGKVGKLVVAGCLSQRYPEELAAELPEVDLFIGTGEVPRVLDILREHERNLKRKIYVGVPEYIYNHTTPRLRATPNHTAFLKVSEGCDHKCAFCIIPQLRGPHRSRSIESVISEANALATSGVKEINLIAQDLTAYGRDRKDGTTLYALLRQLETVPQVEWIRLLYSYPNFLDRPLLDLIRDSATVCKYIDIPLQHASPAILQRMRRGKAGSAVRDAVARLRDAIPGLTLRTSLIVGFPGESDDDFEVLLDFIEEEQFDRLGIFKYSDEDGTQAARMTNKVSEEIKENRWQVAMDLQANISRSRNEALIGTTHRVMIDGVDSETGLLTGRTQAHAPEVDGNVIISQDVEGFDPAQLQPGDFVNVKITAALDYDLVGETLNG